MTKPSQNGHYSFASVPALSACDDADNSPHRQIEHPIAYGFDFHDFTLQSFGTIPQHVGYVNGR